MPFTASATPRTALSSPASAANGTAARESNDSAQRSVTVRVGDTMSGIAARHNVTLDALVRANPHVTNPDLIFPGQDLRIPSAAPAQDTSATAAPSAGAPAAGTPQVSADVQRGARERALASNGATAARLGVTHGRMAPMLADVANGSAVFDRGAQGASVTDLQRRLTGVGFGVQQTGVFGPTTEGVVKAFQAAHGVEQTGQVGKTTLEALDRAEMQAVREGKMALSPGDEGGAVRLMQEELTKAGFEVQATGIFGETTRGVLQDFQRARGLVPDGVFGPPAANALAGGAAPSPGTGSVGGAGGVSPSAQAQMDRLHEHARARSAGKRPDGFCYKHVANFLDQVPAYGKIGNRQFDSQVPGSHWAEARQFAEWANRGDNAAKMGLRRLNIDNPYDAPPGAIVVVRAGTPGTAHATAGDIAVRGTGNNFYNGGSMSYGGRQSFPPGNNLVLGIYVPA
jgi:peptidoglycan hydrolase-like protein with peptidoglycan-binding domain